MTVLVAGGAGFVAVTLIEQLLARGESVVGIDNFSRGSPANVARFDNLPSFRLIESEISDLPSFKSIVSEIHATRPITAVWHLAANSDIPAGIADARVDLKDTFMTTFNILEVMQSLDIPSLFFASSSAIYGDLGTVTLTENIGPLFPISNYGAMKLASEALITAAAEKFLKRALLFRFPNVVGVPATHGVLLDFIRRLKKDHSHLTVLGDGTQQKAYLHVSDLIEAMLLLEKTDTSKVDAFNIGPTDAGVTVRRIAEETVAHVAPNAELQFGSGNKGWVGDVPYFSYSTAKLQKLGWAPKLDSLGAIKKAIHEIAEQESA